MTSKKPTKAQLIAELAQLTQERDDAWIALHNAQQMITDYQMQPAKVAPARFGTPARVVELHREVTPQGDLLRAGDQIYQAMITPRPNGTGYKVVAPVVNANPVITSLSPDGIGHLPEHALQKLMKA